MRNKLWLGALSLVAIVGISVLLGEVNRGKTVTPVDTGIVKRGAFSVTVSCSGIVQPKEHSEVRSTISGRIERVMVEEGEAVSRGQLLVIFDTRDLAVQLKEAEAALAGAKADLAELSAVAAQDDDPQVRQAKARLEAARARYEEVSSGPSQAQVAQAKATLDEAAISLAEAEKALNISRALFDQGAISKNELDSAASKHKAARARYESARQQYDELVKGPRSTQLEVALAEVREAEAGLSVALDNARNKAQRKAAAEMRLSQAKSSLSAIQARLRASEVRAPVPGVVTDLRCADGQLVSEGTLLVKVSDLRNVIIKAKVDEVDITKVSPGQPAVIMSDAVAGSEFKGRVSKIAPEAMQENAVAKFDVNIDVLDRGGLLKPGVSADAEITVYSRDDAVLVPSQAVVERDDEEVPALAKGDGRASDGRAGKGQANDDRARSGRPRKVVLVVRDGKVQEVPVETGAESAMEIEVLKGLAGGEEVVTGDYEALRTLKEGDTVRPRRKAGPGGGLSGSVRLEVSHSNSRNPSGGSSDDGSSDSGSEGE